MPRAAAPSPSPAARRDPASLLQFQQLLSPRFLCFFPEAQQQAATPQDAATFPPTPVVPLASGMETPPESCSPAAPRAPLSRAGSVALLHRAIPSSKNPAPRPPQESPQAPTKSLLLENLSCALQRSPALRRLRSPAKSARVANHHWCKRES